MNKKSEKPQLKPVTKQNEDLVNWVIGDVVKAHLEKRPASYVLTEDDAVNIVNTSVTMAEVLLTAGHSGK